MANKDDDYEVGYSKPPIDTQFKPGVSGNPAGRPKGRPNMATVLRQELERKVTINENGKQKKVTLMEAGCKQLAHKVAKGDLKAMQLVLEIVVDSEDDASVIHDALNQAEDSVILEKLKARFIKHVDHEDF